MCSKNLFLTFLTIFAIQACQASDQWHHGLKIGREKIPPKTINLSFRNLSYEEIEDKLIDKLNSSLFQSNEGEVLLDFNVKPPKNSNVSFVRMLEYEMKSITNNLIPNSAVAIKTAISKDKTGELISLKVTLFVKTSSETNATDNVLEASNNDRSRQNNLDTEKINLSNSNLGETEYSDTRNVPKNEMDILDTNSTVVLNLETKISPEISHAGIEHNLCSLMKKLTKTIIETHFNGRVIFNITMEHGSEDVERYPPEKQRVLSRISNEEKPIIHETTTENISATSSTPLFNTYSTEEYTEPNTEFQENENISSEESSEERNELQTTTERYVKKLRNFENRDEETPKHQSKKNIGIEPMTRRMLRNKVKRPNYNERSERKIRTHHRQLRKNNENEEIPTTEIPNHSERSLQVENNSFGKIPLSKSHEKNADHFHTHNEPSQHPSSILEKDENENQTTNRPISFFEKYAREYAAKVAPGFKFDWDSLNGRNNDQTTTESIKRGKDSDEVYSDYSRERDGQKNKRKHTPISSLKKRGREHESENASSRASISTEKNNEKIYESSDSHDDHLQNSGKRNDYDYQTTKRPISFFEKYARDLVSKSAPGLELDWDSFYSKNNDKKILELSTQRGESHKIHLGNLRQKDNHENQRKHNSENNDRTYLESGKRRDNSADEFSDHSRRRNSQENHGGHRPISFLKKRGEKHEPENTPSRYSISTEKYNKIFQESINSDEDHSHHSVKKNELEDQTTHRPISFFEKYTRELASKYAPEFKFDWDSLKNRNNDQTTTESIKRGEGSDEVYSHHSDKKNEIENQSTHRPMSYLEKYAIDLASKTAPGLELNWDSFYSKNNDKRVLESSTQRSDFHKIKLGHLRKKNSQGNQRKHNSENNHRTSLESGRIKDDSADNLSDHSKWGNNQENHERHRPTSSLKNRGREHESGNAPSRYSISTEEYNEKSSNSDEDHSHHSGIKNELEDQTTHRPISFFEKYTRELASKYAPGFKFDWNSLKNRNNDQTTTESIKRREDSDEVYSHHSDEKNELENQSTHRPMSYLEKYARDLASKTAPGFEVDWDSFYSKNHDEKVLESSTQKSESHGVQSDGQENEQTHRPVSFLEKYARDYVSKMNPGLESDWDSLTNKDNRKPVVESSTQEPQSGESNAMTENNEPKNQGTQKPMSFFQKTARDLVSKILPGYKLNWDSLSTENYEDTESNTQENISDKLLSTLAGKGDHENQITPNSKPSSEKTRIYHRSEVTPGYEMDLDSSFTENYENVVPESSSLEASGYKESIENDEKYEDHTDLLKDLRDFDENEKMTSELYVTTTNTPEKKERNNLIVEKLESHNKKGEAVANTANVGFEKVETVNISLIEGNMLKIITTAVIHEMKFLQNDEALKMVVKILPPENITLSTLQHTSRRLLSVLESLIPNFRINLETKFYELDKTRIVVVEMDIKLIPLYMNGQRVVLSNEKEVTIDLSKNEFENVEDLVVLLKKILKDLDSSRQHDIVFDVEVNPSDDNVAKKPFENVSDLIMEI